MIKTLYGKLSIVLIGMLCLLGTLYILLTLYSTRLYFQEVNQKLNRTLAENLIKEKGLTIQQGRYDTQVLKTIFDTYMVVNPSIEVYLLDNSGAILAYSAPPGKVKRERISLGPIREFIDRKATLPITGQDPRDRHREKIFSAAPIGPKLQPDGYLYVVLASEDYASVAQLLEGSFILKLSTWTLAGGLLLGVLAGLFLFNLLTRRLRQLDAAIAEFQGNNFSRSLQNRAIDFRSQDELGRLSRTFKRMADRILEQMDSLKRTDALRRELVANVSHDLRTPIASLQGYLETLQLKEHSLSEEQRREYIEIAIKHSERLGKLVAELFELARLDSGHTRLQREPFSLSELVQDVALKYRLNLDSKGIHLDTKVPKDLPFVDADIGLIERVLENLLDNAVKHTPNNGNITVALEQHDQMISVHVMDSGCGIAPGELKQIFNRYYQGSQENIDAGTGIGLGLAIAKRILQLHATDIQVDSNPNAGTHFDFSLPICAI